MWWLCYCSLTLSGSHKNCPCVHLLVLLGSIRPQIPNNLASFLQMILDLLLDVLLLLIQPHYPINITICPQILPNYTVHIWISSLPKWHLLCIINISVHFGVCQSGQKSFHFATHIGFGVHPRSPRLQPTCPPGKKGWSLSPFSARRRWNDIWAPCQMWVQSPLMRCCQEWSLLFQLPVQRGVPMAHPLSLR